MRSLLPHREILAKTCEGELRGKVGSNALWPLTYISTEAIRLIMSEEGRQKARDPSIMADAALAMLSKQASTYSCVLSLSRSEVWDAALTASFRTAGTLRLMSCSSGKSSSELAANRILRTCELTSLDRFDSAKLASYGHCKFADLQEDLFIPDVRHPLPPSATAH